MISFILDFATLIFLKIPLAFIFIYFLSIVGSSFFGGPIWLWFIVNSIISFFAIKESYDKAKIKVQKELESQNEA